MSFWLSYVGIGFAGRAIPYFDDPPHAAVLGAGGARYAAAARGRAGGVRAGPAAGATGPFFLVLALVGLLVMWRGLPRRDAPASRADVHLQPRGRGALPARVLQGRAAAGRCAWPAWPGSGRERPGLAALGAPIARARGMLAALPCLARRRCRAAVLALAAWPLVTGRAQDRQVSFKRVPSAWRAGGRATSTARCRRTRGRWCCPGICSRSTPGVARSTRSCRRSAAAGGERTEVPVCRSARHRSAVDDRRPGTPAAAAAGPARAAAGV